jgi:hypothetical protein
MTPSTPRVPRLVAPMIVAALVLAACGDDEDDSAPVTEPPVEESAGTAVEVVAFDYGYNGIPDTVEAGTVFTLVNTAPAELHEFVALRLPDDETRPVSELVTLPIEELGAILAVDPGGGVAGTPRRRRDDPRRRRRHAVGTGAVRHHLHDPRGRRSPGLPGRRRCLPGRPARGRRRARHTSPSACSPRSRSADTSVHAAPARRGRHAHHDHNRHHIDQRHRHPAATTPARAAISGEGALDAGDAA